MPSPDPAASAARLIDFIDEAIVLVLSWHPDPEGSEVLGIPVGGAEKFFDLDGKVHGLVVLLGLSLPPEPPGRSTFGYTGLGMTLGHKGAFGISRWSRHLNAIKSAAQEILRASNATPAPARRVEVESERSALNWLQAKFLEQAPGEAIARRQEFHDHLMQAGIPVMPTVDQCKERGWIVEAPVMGMMKVGGKRGIFQAADSADIGTRLRIPYEVAPGYRILEAVRSAIVPATAPVAPPVRPNISPLFPKGIPDSANVQDVAVRIDAARGSGRPEIEIIREFFGESYPNDPKSQSLQSQLRRMRRKGRLRRA